jgi:hypothetical protein
MKSETENLCSRAPPAPGASEMSFYNPEGTYEKMEEECVPQSRELYFRNFVNECNMSKMTRSESFRPHFDYNENQGSECFRQNSEVDQEEASSASTKDSGLIEPYYNIEGSSYTGEDNYFDESTSDWEMDLTKRILYVLRERSYEEKAYIEKIFPMLLHSVQEVLSNNQLPLNNDIIAVIVNELVNSKLALLAAERDALESLAGEEMEDISYDRPEDMITEEELAVSTRKEKRATKGNRNGSSVNHLNENYVSNIFQFAKRNYPEDKEVQRIGNERNVSALNFKRLIDAKLTDGIMTRKAKARIAESGKELVGNIEYWMKDGYFEQCSDREKYIYHKQKALRDLALAGKY